MSFWNGIFSDYARFDGVFFVAGSLLPGLGGSVLAHGETIEELERRVSHDPFVVENVVIAEIFEIDAKKTDERLGFLMALKATAKSINSLVLLFQYQTHKGDVLGDKAR